MADTDYARPEMLTDTEWLAGHLPNTNDANICIVDCDNREAYRRAHIPGAITFRGHNYLKEKEGAPYIMGPGQFAETMGALGIGDDTLVIAYDGFSGLYATRFWWALNYYGYTQAKVLNGGWDAWLTEGRPVTNMIAKRAAATFTSQPNEELIARWEYVRDAINHDECVLLDVRSDAEWTGENARGTKRGGRVPSAVHLEWLNFVDSHTKKFKPGPELWAVLAEVGVTPESEVVTY